MDTLSFLFIGDIENKQLSLVAWFLTVYYVSIVLFGRADWIGESALDTR